MRARHGSDAVLIGFTTHAGTVTAASDWGAPAERRHVRRALAGSYQALLHVAGVPAFLLCPLGDSRGGRALREPRLERAIGVIYRPASERASHYLTASLSRQFDALVHVDATRAVEPLERTGAWELGEPPETYPTAI
jgi:erythromycin esterase-like protein